MLEITLLPLLSDNYAYLLRDTASGLTAVVDPSEAPPVIETLTKRGLTLDFVLDTHHHGDHTGGNRGLVERYGARIVAPRYDAHRIPGIDQAVADGDTFSLGESEAKVLHIPGHTTGHVAFWFEADLAVFCGDTLFSLGCGRMFEGTPAQMWASLSRLAGLPEATRVFCGHEYTAANARFARTVEPESADLARREAEVTRLRSAGLPTIPSTIGEERRTNPFLRAGGVEAFARLRQEKDTFKG